MPNYLKVLNLPLSVLLQVPALQFIHCASGHAAVKHLSFSNNNSGAKKYQHSITILKQHHIIT